MPLHHIPLGRGQQACPRSSSRCMARRTAWLEAMVLATGVAGWWAQPAHAGDRLLATWGVNQVEGAGGGGLTPWATISGTGSSDQIGATVFATHADTQGDYRLKVVGTAVGLRDRVELSMARWSFKLADDVVPGKALEMSVLGAKVKVLGDAVYDQDTWVPQVSVGVLYKIADDVAALRSLGLPIRASHDYDLYASATKVWLGAAGGYNVLGNLTLRWTRANQFGLLGFGSSLESDHGLEVEGSLGLMLRDDLVVGAEYRTKPDNFGEGAFQEEDAYDLFVAWFPYRHVSLTAAWLNLGNIATKKNQRGLYLSGQVAF